jgi:CHASE3 domain sensor protein
VAGPARSRAAVAHTLQVIDAARILDEAIQDAQSGERGFIITGNLEYLEPYTKGIEDAPARLAELKKLTKDNPEQQRRLDLLEEQINIELSQLKRSVDARKNEGFRRGPSGRHEQYRPRHYAGEERFGFVVGLLPS